ncbi:hypothetical protein ACH5RR_017966 [Cinchona calisaya]|uniref:Uncharacterized protein n=1 Tax=Cinchona calisaya TaxID=153742 RepID=A0ABD2ZMZ4_9GENT
MDAGSDEESNKNMNQSPPEGQKKPKRQMKTPFQLEILEKTYANETYPSEETRAGLTEKLGLTDRQLQMWFCHRRLKNKKEAAGMVAMKPRAAAAVGKRGLMDLPRDEMMLSEPGSEHVSGSGSGSGSGSSQFDNGDEMPMVPIRYYESPKTIKERRVIACVEAQLGEPLREDGPILGVEFDELPPGAFGTPIAEHREQYRHPYDNKLYGSYETKQIKAAPSSLHEPAEPKIRSDAYGQVAPPYLYDSPVAGPNGKMLTVVQGNGHLSREYGPEGQTSSASILSQQGRPGHILSPPTNDALMANNEDVMQMERKRKSDEARIEREVQAHEKRIRKELEKQDLLRRKREEQMQKEMEKQNRERRKEEQRMMREQQRKEERFQREERRELERREKLMQKELLQVERKKQKEEARQKAAMERAAARRIAKESLELIEDERLELMELAASSKGLPSIVSLDYDTLQGLESFRESLCKFPPESVKVKKPFAIQPWIDLEDNVGNLLMVWRFCITFADVLGLWPFTLDEFVQAFHDYESRLLGEIHIALLRMIIQDIEDVARTPSGGPGTNQYSAVNPEGGHPQIVEGAYVWGFDIRSWQKHLNPLTWPEILRQFALSAGFGPQLKKKSTERGGLNDNDETKGCEDIVSTLRNGSAAENAVAIMQEKGFSLQRKSRHRLTPGTVKFAAYHVLALEGSKGLNVLELADKIQKSGLRDLSTSKTPEASISVALSRDPILFERIAPSTYNVRPAYRKDPADAEAIISEAREKIQRFVNGVLTGQNAEDEERDDDSDCDVAEGPEVDDLGTPSEANKKGEGCNEAGTCSRNGKDILTDDIAVANEFGSDAAGASNSDPGAEIDESRSGEPWVQGLTEGEYSELSVEERLNALVVLVGVANEGNSIRVILEDRLDAANALKKQMWAEAQLDKRRIKEEIITKFSESAYGAATEGSQSQLALVDNRNGEASLDIMEKDEPGRVDNAHNQIDTLAVEKNSLANDTSFVQTSNSIQQNGLTAERSRMQLKAFVGHTAEEMYVFRSLPLGSDRRRNRYWLFVASPSSPDPGSGRIFVESPDGYWRLMDSVEAFDALSKSLDMRGIRESHLHIMLQKIEIPFRERVRKNLSFSCIPGGDGLRTGDELAKVPFSPGCDADLESPSSTLCGMNYNPLEPSTSFEIELGKNETERENVLKRYHDLQIWTWKECVNSTVLRAMTYGKKRCTPLLGSCHLCLGCYINVESHGHSCHITSKADNRESFLEQRIYVEEKLKVEPVNFTDSNPSHPFRILLIKVLLNSLEASVPYDALQSSWTEDLRKTWAAKLLNASRTDDLLQILTQFEGAIKRDSLSSNFETTEELLSYCASSKVTGYYFAHPPSVSQLPWIPQTTAAVALRLLELDASILHSQHEKPKLPVEKKMEHHIKLPSKYAHTGQTQKIPTMESKRDKQQLKEETWDYTGNAPGSSDYKQIIRGRGIGRPHGRWAKGVAGSISESGRRNVKHGGTLTEVLMHQEEISYGHKHGRGRRTLRKRRTEKKLAEETLPGRLADKGSIRIVKRLPIHSGGAEEVATTNIRGIEDNSNSTDDDDDDGVDSDDNAPETTYDFAKWDTGFTVAPHRTNNNMMEKSDDEGDDSEDGNGGDEDVENLGDLGINHYECDRPGHRNVDEGSDSMVSGDGSD